MVDIFVSSIHDKSKATLATGLPAKGNFNKESMSELSNELVRWKKVRMDWITAMSCAYVASGQFDQYQEKGIFLWDIVKRTINTKGKLEAIIHLSHILWKNSK